MGSPRKNPPSVSREVFEIHLEYMNKNMKDIKDELVKVGTRQEAFEKTLLRNTITVEEHHKRSNILELNQEKFLTTMTDLTTKVQQIGTDFHRLESDIIPLKAQTEKVNKAVNFFVFVDNNKMMVFKITLFAVVILYAAAMGAKDIEWIRKLIF
jgi:hypothetical protein